MTEVDSPCVTRSSQQAPLLSTDRRPRTEKRRRVLWVLTNVMLSILLSVSLAWICALRTYDGIGYECESITSGWYMTPSGQKVEANFSTRGASPGSAERYLTGDATLARTFWERDSRTDFHLVDRRRHCFGIPFPSMYYDVISRYGQEQGRSLAASQQWEHNFSVEEGTASRLGYPWSAPGGGHFQFPVGVLWRQFAGDIVFWMILCLALTASPTLVRHWYRARNHLCLACSYCLTGNTSGVCPECGERI